DAEQLLHGGGAQLYHHGPRRHLHVLDDGAAGDGLGAVFLDDRGGGLDAPAQLLVVAGVGGALAEVALHVRARHAQRLVGGGGGRRRRRCGRRPGWWRERGRGGGRAREWGGRAGSRGGRWAGWSALGWRWGRPGAGR